MGVRNAKLVSFVYWTIVPAIAWQAMRHTSFVPAQDVKASKQTSSGKVSWFDLFV